MTRLFIVSSLCALVACGGESNAPAAAAAAEPATATPQEAPKPAAAEPAPEAAEPAPFEAATAFNTVCATCHGAAGDGKGPAGGALQPPPANFTDPAFWEGKDKAHIAKAIKEGGPAVGKSPLMAGFGAQYDDAQIDALADHVLAFKPAAE